MKLINIWTGAKNAGEKVQAQRDRARQARQTSSAIRPMRGRRR